MGICKKCGIVKSTKLIDGEQICEDCLKDKRIIDKEVLKKQQNELKNGIVGALLFLSILGIFYFMVSESDEEKQEKELIRIEKEVIDIEKTIKDIPKNDISKNYDTYKILSNFYKDNINYKNEYEKYEKLDKLSSDCFYKGHSLNRENLLNKSTYSLNSFGGDNRTIMMDEKTIVVRMDFSAKNDFGTEINFISEYECKVDGTINQLSMNRR